MKKLTIAFWDNYLCERGTTVSLTDYAHYNECYLYNRSIIMYNKNSTGNVASIVSNLERRFKTYGLESFDKIEDVLINEHVDLLYVIKSGENDGKFSKRIKTVIHCVFNCYQPHGDIYASISPWVNGNNGKYPTVGHMVNLSSTTKNMKERLKIPYDAIVFGRYGGVDTFNIQYVLNLISIIAKNNPNIYFLFANTKRFCEVLPNIIHLDMICDIDAKTEFINTCDAMIHARLDGETFGMSIAEFSSKNKPIITTTCGDICHLHLLGNKAVIYNNQSELEKIILSFKRENYENKDWNAYEMYTPQKIMDQFESVFITPFFPKSTQFTLNDIFIYIFSWKHVTTNAMNLYNAITTAVKTNVIFINCDENIKIPSSMRGVQLDDSYYYGGQYQTALRETPPGKIVCCITGDVSPSADWSAICNNCIEVMNCDNAGIYAPNVEITYYTNKVQQETKYRDALYDVPNTDCTCWFIHPNVVEPLRWIPYKDIVNLGWGTDTITIMEARRQQMRVLRDYSVLVIQPAGTNYSHSKAKAQQYAIEHYYKLLCSIVLYN